MLLPALAFITVITHPIVAASNSKLDVQKYEGETSGKYIVKLKGSSSKDTFMRTLSDSSGVTITHEWTPAFFNGFAGQFDEEALESLLANSDVEYIAEDGIMEAFSVHTQTDAPWGLSRISQTKPIAHQDASALTYHYSYNNNTTHDVDVYILDTGIRVTHEDFEGRASWGATFGGYEDADRNGHGTHCAGTVGSATYGVAKTSNLIAVKVLGDHGAGSSTDIISGLQFVHDSAEKSGNPSVASMSLGGGAFTPIDDAVTALIGAGVHVVVAAGNEAIDAEKVSPARVRAAITVGASDINDTIADFSNFGKVVDIFAPGVFIVSTSNTSDTANGLMSGTSMATPHVAGLLAYLIGVNGNGSPKDLTATLKNLADADAVHGAPKDTVDLLARNDV